MGGTAKIIVMNSKDRIEYEYELQGNEYELKKNFILYVGYDDHAEGDNHKYLENHSHTDSLFSFSSGRSQLNNIIFDALYLYFTSTNLRFPLYGQLPLAGLRPPQPHIGKDLWIAKHCKNSGVDIFTRASQKATHLHHAPRCS